MTTRKTMSALAGALLSVGLLVAAGTAFGQAGPAPYGTPINAEQAKKLMAGAEAEAKKNNWPVAISIVDSGGNLVMMMKLDNTQHGSVAIATGKATTSVNLKRPTKALQDAIAAGGGGLRLLAVEGITPLEGGVPVIVDGKIIGGVGVSGVTSEQDAQVANAGIAALKP